MSTDMNAFVRRAAGYPAPPDNDTDPAFPVDYDDWRAVTPDDDQGHRSPDRETTPADRINDRIRAAAGIEVHRDRRGHRVPEVNG